MIEPDDSYLYESMLSLKDDKINKLLRENLKLQHKVAAFEATHGKSYKELQQLVSSLQMEKVNLLAEKIELEARLSQKS